MPSDGAADRRVVPVDPKGGRFSESPSSRRIQRMGSVTVGVSLPREWVGTRGLVAGQPVFVRMLPDGSLILRDTELRLQPVISTLTIDPQEPGEHMFRRLVGAYLAGATEFVLSQPTGLTPDTRAIARSFARRIGHIESVSEDRTTMLLRDVSIGSGLPAAQLLRRMFQLVYDLQFDAGSSWNQRLSAGADFDNRDDEVDRCAWQVERLLGLELSGLSAEGSPRSDVGEALRFLLWARDLERIGDHAVLIAQHGTRLAEATPPAPLRRMLSSYHAQVLDHLRSANAVVESPDANRANAVLDIGEALHQTQSALADQLLMQESTGRLPASAIRSLGLILQSIDRTTAYAQNLAELGLDRALDRATRPLPPLSAAPPPDPSISSRPTTRGRKKQE
jgi:phosphate uptake regulator